jgi:hypothetical protein
LERRAERILVCPFDEVTFARVVAIASSVTAGGIDMHLDRRRGSWRESVP